MSGMFISRSPPAKRASRSFSACCSPACQAEPKRAREGLGARVVAEPGGRVVANANGENQPVVAKRTVAGDELALLAVDGAHLGVDEGVARRHWRRARSRGAGACRRAGRSASGWRAGRTRRRCCVRAAPPPFPVPVRAAVAPRPARPAAADDDAAAAARGRQQRGRRRHVTRGRPTVVCCRRRGRRRRPVSEECGGVRPSMAYGFQRFAARCARAAGDMPYDCAGLARGLLRLRRRHFGHGWQGRLFFLAELEAFGSARRG